MRIVSVSERGETLYVGSPTSAYRLRVYNKSAQSGLKPQEGEYIRFEIVFRNTLADSAYKAYLEGDMRAYFLGYLSQMVDEVTLNLVRHILDKDKTIEPRVFETEDNKGLEGTKMWLENIVMPCIQKLYLRDPVYVSNLIERLDKILEDSVE
jgi:DNA relaxase NicK